MKRFFVVLGCWISLMGCGTSREKASLFGPEEVGVLVIDALLIVDRPLPALFVRETIGPGEVYTARRAGLTDAEVLIQQDVQTYVYRADPEGGGRYLPPDGAPLVLPETTYDLTVRSQGREARATTKTPPRLVMQESVWISEGGGSVERQLKTFQDGEDLVYTAPENRIIYQDGLLEARFNPQDVKGYHVSIESLDPDSKAVLESEFEEDFDRFGSSPPFEIKDGKLPMPWFIVFYEGRHLIRFYAVDENWFDLIRSVPQFYQEDSAFAPGGLAGDNFERPLFHVEGGIGLFGSASVDSLGFVVLPRN